MDNGDGEETVTDPFSGEKIPATIDNLKLWVENNVPFGLPLVYAAAGIVIMNLITWGVFTLLIILDYGLFNIRMMIAITLFVSIMWGIGGWTVGKIESYSVEEKVENGNVINETS